MDIQQWLWIAALGLGGMLALIFLAIEGQVRLAFALVFLSIFLGLASVNVHWSILATFGYLTLLGDIRRWIIPFDGWSGADPLLVVGPVVGTALWIVAITSDRVDFDTSLSKWILVLMAIMAVQIFNPAQGGLMVGMTGAVFLLVPLLWYWVGKSFGSEAFLRTFFFRLVVPLAFAAALLGFYQVFFGYPEYQLEWYRVGGYSALGPSEEYLRPLSVFPNITEYVRYLGVAILALVALLLRKRWVLPSVLGIAVLFTALFLTGTRGSIVFIPFAVAVMWAILGRSAAVWLPRLAFALVIGAFGLFFGLGQVNQLEGEGRAQYNLQRQANLIPDEGGGGGTVADHLNLIRIGVVRTIDQPLGRGIGSITMAAGKFGSGGFSTEKDFTDMFLALGVPGGVVYLIVLGYTTLLAVRYWIRTRSTVGLIIIGILISSVFQWMQPGQYVMTPLLWFCVGALDHIQNSNKSD